MEKKESQPKLKVQTLPKIKIGYFDAFFKRACFEN